MVGFQLGNEAAAGERAPQTRVIPDRLDAYRTGVFIQLEVHLVPGPDTETLAEVLRDDDLSLRSDLMSHTNQYN